MSKQNQMHWYGTIRKNQFQTDINNQLCWALLSLLHVFSTALDQQFGIHCQMFCMMQLFTTNILTGLENLFSLEITEH